MWRKSCPRCYGDLLLQRDIDGTEIACLQCGYVLPAPQAAAMIAAGRSHNRSVALRPPPRDRTPRAA